LLQLIIFNICSKYQKCLYHHHHAQDVRFILSCYAGSISNYLLSSCLLLLLSIRNFRGRISNIIALQEKELKKMCEVAGQQAIKSWNFRPAGRGSATANLPPYKRRRETESLHNAARCTGRSGFLEKLRSVNPFDPFIVMLWLITSARESWNFETGWRSTNWSTIQSKLLKYQISGLVRNSVSTLDRSGSGMRMSVKEARTNLVPLYAWQAPARDRT
jgi:hypothetical protein